MEDSDISMVVASDESATVNRNGLSCCCLLCRRCRAGCCSFFRKINAEPVILLSMTALGLVTTIMPLFLYWARCVQIFSERTNVTTNVTEFCFNLTEQNVTYQDLVERDIATWKIYLQLASGVPTFLIAPILGAWADGSGGRKKPLIISIVGLNINFALQAFATTIYKKLPVYPFFLMAELLAGLCGGMMTLFATSFAIATDDSRQEMRHGDSGVTIRIAIASALQTFGTILGGVLASVCTVRFSHEKAYMMGAFIGCCTMFITLLYTLFLVRETLSKTEEAQETTRPYNNLVSFLRYYCCGAECWVVVKKQGLNLIQVLIVKREGWTRFVLNTSLLYAFVEVLALDSSILLLITKRPPFEWTDEKWTNFSIFKNLSFAIGMIVFPALIARTPWLGKDSILIMSGIFSAAVISIVVSFARSTELLFICAAFSFFAGGISPGFRSFIPRMVHKEETARLFTAFGVVLALCPILSSLMFNSIFNATLHFWPSFAFLIAGSIMLAVLCGQCLSHLLMRPLWLRQSIDGLEPLIDGADENVSDGDDSLSRHSRNPIA